MIFTMSPLVPCKYCGRKRRVDVHATDENPFCAKCLHARVAATSGGAGEPAVRYVSEHYVVITRQPRETLDEGPSRASGR